MHIRTQLDIAIRRNSLKLAAIGALGERLRKITLLGLAAVSLVAATTQLAAFQSGAADPRIGVWTLISAESTLDPPNQLTITPDHGGAVHVAMTGETRFDFTAKPDGHETAVPGNPAFNQIELHRIDKRLTEVKEEKDGTLVATVRNQLSKDGKELTTTTVKAGHPDQVTVWTRTGGVKAPGDPLAGEWTQDLGKSHLRQSPILKIEADGTGGVRFSGEFTYTARLDGKQADVKNSRNDTVALTLVDPHTVDATYRRDDQITQKDRWVVSADRNEMTLTTTGTFETGQKVTEKLVFKRQ